jgi:kynurenine formamidase
MNGDSCNTMIWTLPNHAGTHVDAPKHFIEAGKTVVDFKSKEWFFNKINILDIDLKGRPKIIEENDLGNFTDCEMLLIRTGFEKRRNSKLYYEKSPGLHPDLAEALIRKCPSLRAVGIDFISIASSLDRALGRKAHKAFLSKNILLIEDMKLNKITDVPDLIVAAPLFVPGADASPCTIFGLYL